MKTYQLKIRKDMDRIWATAKPIKTRSQFEMEKLLQKHKVLARKRQIELLKLDLAYPFQPGNIMQYTTPERRKDFFRVIISYLRYLLP